MLVLNVNPAGSAGDTSYLNGAVPPEPVTGANAIKIILCVSTVAGTAKVAVGIFANTAKLNVAIAVCGLGELSVTVTVNSVLLNATVGVPDTYPVLVLNDNPVGRVGDIEYFNGDDPPEAVLVANPPVPAETP